MGSGLGRAPCNSSSSDVFTSFLLPPMLTAVLSRLSGPLLPTGTSGPQDKEPAGSWGKLCLCLEQVEAEAAGLWSRKSKKLTGRQAGAT